MARVMYRFPDIEATSGDGRSWKPGQGHRTIVFAVGTDDAFIGTMISIAKHMYETTGEWSVVLYDPRACSRWRIESPYVLVAPHQHGSNWGSNPWPRAEFVDESGGVVAVKDLFAANAHLWPPCLDRWVQHAEEFRHHDSLLQFAKDVPDFIMRDTKGRTWSSGDLGTRKRAMVVAAGGCMPCMEALKVLRDRGLQGRVLVVTNGEDTGDAPTARELETQGWDVIVDIGPRLIGLLDCPVIPFGHGVRDNGAMAVSTLRAPGQSFTEWLVPLVE